MRSLDHFLIQLLPYIHTSHNSSFFIHFLSAIQITHLILRTMSFSATPQQFILTSLAKNIRFLTAAFEIVPFSNYNILIQTFWAISTAYLTGFILLNIWIFFKFFLQKRIEIWPMKILAKLYIIHARVLFFPIQFLFSAIISLYSTPSDLFYKKVDWLIFTIIFSFLNFILVFIKEFLLYKFTETQGDFSAAKNNLYHQIIFFYKGAMLTLFCFSQDEIIGMRIGAFFHVIMCSGLMWILYKKLPFYNLHFFQYVVISTAVFFSLAIISIIQVFALENIKILGCVDILLLLLPIYSVKLALSSFKRVFENILKGDLRSPEYAIHFAILLEQSAIVQPRISKYAGFFPHDCAVSGACRNLSPEKNSLLLSIEKRLEEALVRFPQSDLLSIFTTEFQLTKCSNIPRFLELFKRFSMKRKLSIHKRVAIEGYYCRISELYIADKCTQYLDLTAYFKHDDLAKGIRSEILLELEGHIDFWKDIKQGNLDIKKTIDQSLQIDNLSHRLEKLFTQNYEDLKLHFPQILLMYSIYLTDVRYFAIEGKKLFNKFQLILSNQADKTSTNPSESTVIAILSFDKKTPGQILNISGPVYDLFRYNKNHLIGNNFGALLPAPIAKSFQHQIQQYVSSQLDHNYSTYGQSSKGEIFEIEAHFQLFVYGNKEITVALRLQKKSKSQLVCIVDSEGTIVSLSKALKEHFPSETKLSMFDLYYDFHNLNSAFNIIYSPQQEQAFTLIDEKLISPDKILSATEYQISADKTRPFLNTASPTLMEENPQSSDRKRLIPRFSTSPAVMTKERAQHIHDQFTKGKNVVLTQYSDHHFCSQKEQARVKMQVKPLVYDTEVYKIIIFKNLTKEPVTAGINTFPLETEELASPGDYESKSFTENSPGLDPGEEENSSPRNIRHSPIDTFKPAAKLQNNSEHEIPLEDSEEDNSTIIKVKGNISDNQSMKENTRRDARIIKTLQEVFNRKKAHPALSLSIVAVYLAILVILALSITDYKITKSSIYQVSKGINLLDLSADRLSSIINTWQDGIYLYLEALNPGFLGPDLFGYFTWNMGRSISQLALLNNKLKVDILDLSSEKFLAEAYRKDILMWNTLGTGGQFDMYNSFTATDLLVNKYKNAATIAATGNVARLARSTVVPLILNNTANSYMIECSKLNTKTENFVQTIIDNNRNKMTIIVALETCSLIIFWLALISVALVIKNSFKRLFRVLSELKLDSITFQISHLRNVQALLQQDIETKQFIQAGISHFYEKEAPIKHDPQATSPFKASRSRTYISENLNIYLIKIVFSAAFAILLVGFLFIWSLISSLSTFDQLESIKNQVSLFCKMTFQTYLFLNVFNTQVVFHGNPSYTVLNDFPFNVVKDNIDKFLQLNNEISKTFLKENHPDIEPLTLRAMKEDACILLEGPRRTGCYEYSASAGVAGMFEVGIRYLDISKYYIGQLKVNPADALSLSLSYTSDMSSVATILQNGYPRLSDHALRILGEKVEDAKKRQRNILIVNSVLIFLYSIFLYLVPFRKFKELDLARRKILKIIPYPVVQENKVLSYYLVKDFSKEVEGIKSVL